MSTTSTFAVGLGSGLALWYLTKSKATTAAAFPSASSPGAGAKTPRNCAVRIDANGLSADGARVNLTEAVRRCMTVGRAAVSVSPDASASTYAELMKALGADSTSGVRNAGKTTKRRRATRRNRETSSTFTLAIYPNGFKGSSKRIAWFRADAPTTWEVARERLIAARVIDPTATSPTMAGYWKLTTEPRVFDATKATALPELSKRTRDAARGGPRFTTEGRTILRDGEPILYIDRVDLGNQRYAISPHEADVLTQKMARHLDRRGARP